MNLRERVKDTVQRQIETAMDEVVANNETHTGKREKVCQQCFRSKPQATKKCGHCSSSEFQDYICSKEVHLSLFLEWLKTQGFWPLSQLNKQSCREFRGNVSAIASNCTPCGHDGSCPLNAAKERLVANLRARPHNCLGLNLKDYNAQ